MQSRQDICSAGSEIRITEEASGRIGGDTAGRRESRVESPGEKERAYKDGHEGTSLVVHWLRLPSSVEGVGSIFGPEDGTQSASWSKGQKKKDETL